MAALGSLKALVRRFVECRTASAMRCLNVRNLQNVQIIGMACVVHVYASVYVYNRGRLPVLSL